MNFDLYSLWELTMRRLLWALPAAVTAVGFASIASIASAADLPTKAPVYKVPPAVAYNWTGFYVGVNAGYAWHNTTDTLAPLDRGAVGLIVGAAVPNSLPLNSNSFIGGGQLGYNWQFDPRWVAGFETDISWTHLNSTTSLRNVADDGTRQVTANEKVNWIGTLRGRIGVTPADRALLYLTGGLAYGQASLSTALTRPGLGTPADPTGCLLNICSSGSASRTMVGWTVGGGVEWAFIQTWSLKAEYLYYDLGTLSHAMMDPATPAFFNFNASARINGNIARVGLNYRF